MPVLINQPSFLSFVKAAHLYEAAFLFCLLAFYFITRTFIALYIKKRRHVAEQLVEKCFETLISKAMLDEGGAGSEDFIIPANVARHIKNSIKRQYAIDALVKAKKSLRGKAGDNVVKLYLQLGFRAHSVRKFKSGTWYTKAKGIHELYMMDQYDMLTSIYKHTNSVHEHVRMEAQTAIVHFSGFDGLRFLDVISTPVSDWQQVKLLEQLRAMTPKELVSINAWLISSNDTVVIFALKLAEVYQQFQAHINTVQCLSHRNEKIRMQAVKTLVRIADESTTAKLTAQYHKERFTNKLNILNHLTMIASDDELIFLEAELDNGNQFLKIAAAGVIAACCSDGLGLLKERAQLAPQTYAEIYRHIKFQVS
jgi:hypothetical protein